MIDSVFNLTALADEFEQFIKQTVPKATPVQKYGGTLFTLHPDDKEGQFCGVFVYKEHVQIAFGKGAKLKDPKKLLAGGGKFRRHINASSREELDFTELKKLLVQASKL